MTKEQIFSALRSLGVVLLTYLVSSGKLTQDQASVLTNAAMQAGPILGALALAAYGVYVKRPAANALAADKIPGVTVTVDPKTAPTAVVEAAMAPTNDIKISK